jgi:UDP-GlcNAc3NAcA epimerase
MNLELYKEVTPNIRIIDPVGYLDMILLEKNAAIIATDSGGIQKESFFFKVPCIVFRDESEWVELVELGWINLISPSDEEAIVNGFRSLINSPFITNSSDKLYGNGMASSFIAEIIIESKGNN